MYWIELNGVANEMRQWMWSAWIECIWRGHCNIRWHARCLGTSVTFKHILGIWLYGLECSNQAGTVTWQCMIKQAHLRPYPRRSFYHHVCRRIYQQYNLYIPKRLFIFTTYLFICSHRQMCEITPECASGELPPSPRRVCYMVSNGIQGLYPGSGNDDVIAEIWRHNSCLLSTVTTNNTHMTIEIRLGF